MTERLTMNLPAVTLPLHIPDSIPLLLHPAAVHFAVVLPLVILILELVNLITKRKALSVTVYILFFLLTAVFIGAYATGVTDGKEAGPFLSDEGSEALKAHRVLGIYLVYLALLPLTLKVLSLFVKKGWSRALYSLGLVVLIALTFFQAKKGGELVYSYGANVASQQALEARIEELEEGMDTLQRRCEEQSAAGTESNQSLPGSDLNATVPAMEANLSKPGAVDANLSNQSGGADTNGSTDPEKRGDANTSV